MLFKEITILNKDYQIEENMYVGIAGDRIAYIGKEAPSDDFGQVYPGKNRLLMAGFYNGHALSLIHI